MKDLKAQLGAMQAKFKSKIDEDFETVRRVVHSNRKKVEIMEKSGFTAVFKAEVQALTTKLNHLDASFDDVYRAEKTNSKEQLYEMCLDMDRQVDRLRYQYDRCHLSLQMSKAIFRWDMR